MTPGIRRGSVAARALREATLFPLWLDHPSAPDVQPNLIGNTKAELVVVGGGFTGLWAALIAKETNPSSEVVLLEAGKVAHGASGRPGGIVSTSVMHGLAKAVRIFPRDLPELEKLGIENFDGFARAIERLGIDADLELGGELTVAIDQGDLPALARESELRRKFGHTVVDLDRAQVQAEIASPIFQGGLWSRNRSGTVHPAKLAWGLKAAALGLGVRIYEHSPMIQLEDAGPMMVVRTHDGKVSAPRVLLATNAWGSGHKHIKRYIAAVRDRVIATEPLTDEQMARVGWANRQGVYDTRIQLNYMRLTKDNRIVYGGRVGYFFNDNVDPPADRELATYQRLALSFFKTFPQLEDIGFTHAWAGPIAMSTRMAMHFQRYFGGKVVWAGGYSGFGVTASRFGARVGLDLLHGRQTRELDLEFARTLPRRIPREPFRWIGAKLTMHALDDADERRGWRAWWIKFIHWMGFPL
jgi:glycine/D-amino acid oxidase-like deaminating enzyme